MENNLWTLSPDPTIKYEDKYEISGLLDRDLSSFRSIYSMSFDYTFNQTEEKLLCPAAYNIYKTLRDIENKEYQTKNDIKLKKLFPNCFN